MAIKPTKPTSPPQALRSNPESFSARAEGWIAYQATTFPNYIDDIADYVDARADDALAAALGGDLPPLTGQGGKVLAVKDDETGAEFVDDAIGALTTNGFVARTGAGTAAARTLTGTANQIVVTNGDGVEGNPVVSAVIASQAEAEAGTDTTKLMTAQRVKQAVATSLNAPGTAPTYACRAWVNFNGTGTPSIRASGNVSSITDNGTGDYTINLATAMPDANYSLSLACRNEIVAGDLAVNVKQGTDPTASSVRIQCTRFSDGPRDPLYVYAQFFR